MRIPLAPCGALALWSAAGTTTLVSPDDPQDTDDTDVEGPVGPTTCFPLPSSSPTVPEDGALDVFFKSALTVRFTSDAVGQGVVFELEDLLGFPVALETPTWDGTGRTATLLPVDGMAPDTRHTLTIHHGCGTPTTVTFTTGEIGDPVTNPAGLVGRTWDIDLASGTWVQPAGIGVLLGSLIRSYVGDETILLEVSALDAMAGTLDVFLGRALYLPNGGALYQDTCEETYDLTAAGGGSFQDPYFEIVSTTGATVPIIGYPFTLETMVLSGAFDTTGQDLVGLRIAGELDARTLAPTFGPVLGLGTNPSTLCTLVTSFNAPCRPCSSDGATFCLQVDLQDLEADLVTQQGFDFVEAPLSTCP